MCSGSARTAQFGRTARLALGPCLNLNAPEYLGLRLEVSDRVEPPARHRHRDDAARSAFRPGLSAATGFRAQSHVFLNSTHRDDLAA
jgi:hypothetical protein